jgi:hypothetical protein
MMHSNKESWRLGKGNRFVMAVLLSLICSVGARPRGTRKLQSGDEFDYFDLDTQVQKRAIASSNQGVMQMLLRQSTTANENEETVQEPRVMDEQQPTERVFDGGDSVVWTTGSATVSTSSTSNTPNSEETSTPPAEETTRATCNANGYSQFPFRGRDNAERLLLREGVISEIPSSRCGRAEAKNVFLVVGDGMGWEMVRAGAVAKQVIEELESLGCDIKLGCPNNTAAIDAFRGRRLSNYYTEGNYAVTELAVHRFLLLTMRAFASILLMIRPRIWLILPEFNVF